MIRTLANPFTERMQELEAAGAELSDRKDVFAASTLKMAALQGDVEWGKVEVGQTVGLVQDLLPAGELVQRIADEYLAALGELPRAC